MALTLAIDMGTTNLKVGVVDTDGRIVAMEKCANTIVSLQPGWSEHDPKILKEQIEKLCKSALAKVDRNDVKYIIASTYHFGLLLLGEDKQPLTAMSLLTDGRSAITFNEFKQDFADLDIYHRTGGPPLIQNTLPRLYYFSKREPELIKKTKWIADSKSFLFEWLTGEFVTDASIANASQLFNMDQFTWDDTLLQRLSLNADQLPAVEDGLQYKAPLKSNIADRLGLGNNVMVVLGAYDGAALGVALTGLQKDVGIVNVGTTAMFRIVDSKPAFDKDINPKIQAYSLNKDIYLNGGAVNNAALPLDWLRQVVKPIDLNENSFLQYERQPLFSIPYLTGERYCGAGPFASGVFFGLRREHGPRDMIQAVMEGVVYSIRYIYEALNENQITVSQIKMGGGGASVKDWPQLFADILGMPVEIPSTIEMALVGNAIIAFTAGGEFDNIADAKNKLTGTGKIITPVDRHVKIHDQRFAFFKKLRQNMDILFEEHGTTAWLH